jgi:hypothetical protein
MIGANCAGRNRPSDDLGKALLAEVRSLARSERDIDSRCAGPRAFAVPGRHADGSGLGGGRRRLSRGGCWPQGQVRDGRDRLNDWRVVIDRRNDRSDAADARRPSEVRPARRRGCHRRADGPRRQRRFQCPRPRDGGLQRPRRNGRASRRLGAAYNAYWLAFFVGGVVLGMVWLAITIWRRRIVDAWSPALIIVAVLLSFLAGGDRRSSALSSLLLAAALSPLAARVWSLGDDAGARCDRLRPRADRPRTE